jgi:hypothetical protein
VSRDGTHRLTQAQHRKVRLGGSICSDAPAPTDIAKAASLPERGGEVCPLNPSPTDTLMLRSLDDADRHAAAETHEIRKHAMNNTDRTDANTLQQMRQALAAYDGPVERCPPGEAVADPLKPKPVKPTRRRDNKALPLRRNKPRINVVIEARIMKRDRAARWLERHDRTKRKAAWRWRHRRRHRRGAAARRVPFVGLPHLSGHVRPRIGIVRQQARMALGDIM